MDTEEAIKELNSRIELANRYYADLVPEYIEALELAVEALQKQEPMKTILSHGECGCPMCEVTISEGDKYCWHCGQRLDWGDQMKIKMKIEEAYNLIEGCLDYDKDMSEYPERYEMALQIAREVFQKHVPVKPIYDHRYAELGCAFCGSMVSGWEESPNYCPNCGQAIDWREE